MVGRVGDVLASKYRLEELLGMGGMGEVYRAVNELVGRKVAIKILKTEHAENEEIVERFLREAKAANLVRHPNVVDVLDIGTDERGTPFIVQELLTGKDLSQHVIERGGRLSLEEAVDLLSPIIDAVAEAHAQDVVHRDIKPENVFLAKSGSKVVPKLLDFGISKVRASGVRATQVGVMMGTPAYMPPEQVQGARDADARSDVWALGVMLFEVLSGRLPFSADGPAIFVAIATEDAPKLTDVCPEIAPDVSRIVERCLRRLPAERYPSAAELARDLRNVLEGIELEPTQKRSIPPKLAAVIPDLDLAIPAAPHAPTFAQGKRRSAPLVARAETPAKAARDVDANADTSPSVPDVPDLPSLAPPPPKQSQKTKPATVNGAPAPSVASAAPSAPQPAAAPPPPAPPPVATPRRSAIDTALPGMIMAPGSVRSAGKPAAWGRDSGTIAGTPIAADASWVIGLGIVGLVGIGTTALITTFAHQPEGWAIIRFALGADPLVVAIGQGFFAAAAFGVTVRSMLRSVQHWRGDLAGGRPSAIFNAIVAGGFFFAAIELARAAF